MWATRSSIGLSSSSRVFGERCSPLISFRLDDAFESFDGLLIAVGVDNRNSVGAGFRRGCGGLAWRTVFLSCGLPAFALIQFEAVRKSCDSLSNRISMGLFFDLAFEALQPDLLNNSRDVGPFGLEVNLLDGSFDNGVDLLCEPTLSTI